MNLIERQSSAYKALRTLGNGQKAIHVSSQSTIAEFWHGLSSACSDYSTKLPGSTCKMVFILSRKTFALFSSPFTALTLKTFVDCVFKVDSSIFELAIIPCDCIPVSINEALVGDVRVNNSYTSGCLCGPALSVEGFIGNAAICGV